MNWRVNAKVIVIAAQFINKFKSVNFSAKEMLYLANRIIK